MTAADLIERSGKSRAALAREVLELWRRKVPRGDKPKAKSLGTFVGNLAKGRTDWWLNNPVPTECLAQVLDCDHAALLASPTSATGSVPFRDFHELRPLTGNEEAPPIGCAAVLASAIRSAREGRRNIWVVAPPGAGKHFIARHAELSNPDIVVVEAPGILDATRSPDLVPDRLGVIVIRARSAETDDVAFSELLRRSGPTVVLAPFSAPRSEPGVWDRDVVPDDADWRDRFVEWVARRIGDDSRLSSRAGVDLLDHVDPSGLGVATPGDVLPLLAWLYRSGMETADVPLAEIADALVRERLGRAGCSRAVVERGARSLREMVRAAVDQQVNGRRPHTQEEWLHALSHESGPPPSRKAQQEAIDALADARGAQRRLKKEQLEALLADSRPRVVEALIDADLLVEGEDGFDIYPTWIRSAYERVAVDEAASTGDWGRIGRWSASPAVRHRVLETVLRHERRDVVKLAKRLLDSDDRRLAWAAGAEVLFEALAERLAPELNDTPPWKPTATDLEVLASLGAVQAQLVAVGCRARGSTEPTRLTAAPPNWSEVNAAWLVRTWAYSLAVPRPSDLPAEVGWAFPGWLLTSAPEAWLPSVPHAHQAGPESLAVFDALLAVARRVVRAVPGVVGVEAPRLLRAAAIIEGVGDTPPGAMGGEMRGLIARIVETEPNEDVRGEIAVRLWRVLPREPRHDPLVSLADAGPLQDFLNDALAPAAFVEGLDVDSLLESLDRREHFAESLPPRLFEAVLQTVIPKLLTGDRRKFISLPAGISRISNVPLLNKLLDVGYSLGRQAAGRLWQLDAGNTLAELDSRLARGDYEAAASLINVSPPESAPEVLPRALDHLDKLQRFLPWWLAQRVAAGGVDAPRLYEALVELPELGDPGLAPRDSARNRDAGTC